MQVPITKIKATWHVGVDIRLRSLSECIQAIESLSSFGFEIDVLPESRAQWIWRYQMTHNNSNALSAFIMQNPKDITGLLTIVQER
jgi:hypothetical protein